MSGVNLRSMDLAGKMRSTMLYFGATIITFVLSLVTYPLFAEYMGIDEFAALNYFTNYSGFFGFLFSLNLYMYYSAIYFKGTDAENEEALKKFMIILLGWNAVTLALVYALSYWVLDAVLDIKFAIVPYLLSSLAAVSLVSLRSIFLIRLRLAKKAWLFFLFSVLGRVGVLLFSLFFVMYYEPTAHGRLLGALAGEVLCTGVVYWYVFRGGKPPSLRADYSQITSFLWPLLLSSIVYYPITALDQVILEKYVSKTELGLYSIGLGFATYLHTFNFSVYQTIEPDLIKASAQGDHASLKRNSFLLLAVACFTTLVFCFLSKHLIAFLSHDKFTAAYPIANVLSLSFLFVLVFSIGSTLLTTAGKSKRVLLLNFSGLLAIVVFALALRGFGAWGVGWARVLAYLAISLFSIILLRIPLKNNNSVTSRR
jgi:O-antigen/teichoic acid export membrane protein